MSKQSSPDGTASRSIINIPLLSHEVTLCDFVPQKKHLVSDYCCHSLYEITVILRGQILVSVKEKGILTRIPLVEGDIIFINKGIYHQLYVDEGSDYHSCLFLFDVTPVTADKRITSEWVEDENRLFEALFARSYRVTSDARAFSCCRALLPVIEESIASHRIGEFAIIRNHVSTLLMTIFQSFTKLPERADFAEAQKLVSTLSISMIMDYIEDHYAEEITLSDMSEALHYSSRQCQRILQSNLGVSFLQLLTDIRTSNAKQMLRETDLPPGTIAVRCGFGTSQKMSTVFHARTGLSPTAYRAKKRAAAENAAKT